MRLFLIRHGQTPSNLLGALDTGVPGPPLTDLGREQAQVVRDELVDSGVEAIYVSSMRRTHETAAPTAAALGLPVLVRDGLRELAAGELEMNSDDASIERYLRFMTACARGQEDELPGGEAATAVIDRFDAVIEELAGTGAAAAVAFSHGAVLRAWTGLRVHNLSAEFTLEHSLRNTGTVVLDGAPGTGWIARTWDTTPLDDTGVPAGPTGPAGETSD